MNEEDLIEEISVGPGLAKLKSIPLSDEQKQELKQAQSRRREKPICPKVGMRVLFFISPEGFINDAVIDEISLSGNFIHLTWEFGGKPLEAWLDRQHLIEELEAIDEQ